MTTSSHLAEFKRARTFVSTLLLLGILYSFFLDGSVCILLYRATFFQRLKRLAGLTEVLSQNSSSRTHRASGRSEAERPRQAAAAVAATTGGGGRGQASTAEGDDSANSGNMESMVNAGRGTLLLECAWRCIVVMLLHWLWFGSHYFVATTSVRFNPSGTFRDAMKAAVSQHSSEGYLERGGIAKADAATIAFANELTFWQLFFRSFNFAFFTPAWEPFLLPCILPLMDLALLFAEFLVAVLAATPVEKLAVVFLEESSGRSAFSSDVTGHGAATLARSHGQAREGGSSGVVMRQRPSEEGAEGLSAREAETCDNENAVEKPKTVFEESLMVDREDVPGVDGGGPHGSPLLLPPPSPSGSGRARWYDAINDGAVGEGTYGQYPPRELRCGFVWKLWRLLFSGWSSKLVVFLPPFPPPPQQQQAHEGRTFL